MSEREVVRSRDLESNSTIPSPVSSTNEQDGSVGGHGVTPTRVGLAGLYRIRGHAFTPVRGHPDDDECTFRRDGTDKTYCGRPEYQHKESLR